MKGLAWVPAELVVLRALDAKTPHASSTGP
jgi:hypothetical protein